MPRPREAIELMQETLIGEAAATGSAGVVLTDDELGEAEGLRHASRAVMDGATRHGTARLRRKDGSEIEVAYVSFRGSISALQQVVTVSWAVDAKRNGSGGGF